jgi:dihydroorotase
MVGLESAYSIAQQVLIDSGKSSFERLAEVLSTNASAISGLTDQGTYLSVGKIANLTLVDPKFKTQVESKTQSMSENNPYVGRSFTGGVVHTIYDGQFSYRNRQIIERSAL